MEFLKNFVDWITGIVESLVSFFDSIVSSLSQMYDYINYASDTATNLVNSLPPVIRTFGTITILVSILYMIIGRTSGGKKSD